MNLFFDLDGTLIDSKPRLYHLFQHLVPQSNFSFTEYWNLKHQQKDHASILRELLGFTEADISAFQSHWMQRIELREWLVYDKPFDGVTALLEQLSQGNHIYIVTSRQFEDIVKEQINGYGWGDYLKGVFVTGQSIEKQELLTDFHQTNEEDWFIGDTGKDIQAGKALGMKTAAVLSGFRSRQSLEKYQPDIIVDSILDLVFNK